MGLNATVNLPAPIQTVGSLGCLQEVELGRKEEGGGIMCCLLENKKGGESGGNWAAYPAQGQSLKVSRNP